VSPSGPAALTTVLHRLRAAGLELETTRPPSTADMPERMSSADAMAIDTVGAEPSIEWGRSLLAGWQVDQDR